VPDAVYDALYKGLVRAPQILEANISGEARKWLVSAVEAAEQRIYTPQKMQGLPCKRVVD
jgi:hypothetical protein